MKKRILSLLLALTLCVSLVTPALALDQTIQYEDTESGLRSNYTIKNATKKLDYPISVFDGTWDMEFRVPNCFEGDLNTTVNVGGMDSFTVSLLEFQSDGIFDGSSYESEEYGANMYHRVEYPIKDSDRTNNVMSGDELAKHIDNHVIANSKESAVDEYLNSEAGKQMFNTWYKDNGYPTMEAFGAHLLTLDFDDNPEARFEMGLEYPTFKPESYFTFTKPGVYLVSAKDGLSSHEKSDVNSWTVLFIGTPAPDAPVAPTVAPSACAATLDGSAISLNAYLFQEDGGGANYVMLRDVAQLLSGTKAQFEVNWDKDNGIILTTGQAYTPAGNELQSKGDGDKTYIANASIITVDGSAVKLNAYTIEGNNYFKLRDLGTALCFNVGWNSAEGTVTIDSTQPYSGAN